LHALGLEEDSQKKSHASCSKCASGVGVFDPITRAVSLFKWQVNCETNGGDPRPSPDVGQCLAATLMASISRSGSAKTILAPISIGGSRNTRPDGSRSVYLWVLNPNVVYNSTASRHGSSTTALKLLYRSLPVQEGNEIIDAMNSDVQEFNFPTSAIEAIITTLEYSNALLPKKERSLKEWNVGLLRRW
jgi:ubiquitin-protein ligase E3 D